MKANGQRRFHGAHYSRRNAAIYETLGILGTTYEIGFKAAADLLGNLRGLTVLDFGCGTGRSSEFLKQLGARRVIGVDRNHSMLEIAGQNKTQGVRYLAIRTRIPLRDESIAAAFSANVFVELRTKMQMQRVCSEVSRVLRNDGVFVLMSTNPAAFRHNFTNFGYGYHGPLTGGDICKCRIMSGTRRFTVVDTYWDEGDYRVSLTCAGFRIEKVVRPRGDKSMRLGFSEARVAPFILLKCRKKPSGEPDRTVRNHARH